jgi:hypothetical protein
MRHAVFGKLTYDEEDATWSTKRKFAEFVPFRQTPHGKGKAPTAFDLFVEAEDKADPSPAQGRAFEYYVEHEASICTKVIVAIFRWYQRLRKQDREWFEDEECPEISQPDELREFMEFHSLRIHRDEFKGIALVGFSFDCKWDEEHGLGVLMHRGTMLDVGQQEVAFREPNTAGSVWLKVCTEREKQAARTVISSFNVKHRKSVYSPEEKALVEEQKSIDRVRKLNLELLLAFDRKDPQRIRSLIEQGADINGADADGIRREIHPLFSAIRNSNVFTAKTMLELGADPQAEFYGKTLLQNAIETIDLLGYRPGGPLGDRLKDKHDRATEVLRLLREAGAR